MYCLLWFDADAMQLNRMARSLHCVAEMKMKERLHSVHFPGLQCRPTTWQKTAAATLDCSEQISVTVTLGLCVASAFVILAVEPCTFIMCRMILLKSLSVFC